jgi:uncharacterized protein
VSAALHIGDVTHVRHAPFRHRFRYRIWMISCDLDAPQESILFRRNRPGIVSLHDRDHGPRDGAPLRPWVEEKLREAGLGEFGSRIRFMAIPRVLGYAFNPIAFYTCFDAQGRLGAVLHQVRNTFGDQIAYLLPVPEHDGIIRQQTAKRMHVSPFFDIQGGYRFAFSDPEGEEFHLSIQYGAQDAPRLSAAMRLRRAALSDASLVRLLLAMPLMPLKVIAAIHWQALLLYLRGATYHPAPETKTSLSGASR